MFVCVCVQSLKRCIRKYFLWTHKDRKRLQKVHTGVLHPVSSESLLRAEHNNRPVRGTRVQE